MSRRAIDSLSMFNPTVGKRRMRSRLVTHELLTLALKEWLKQECSDAKLDDVSRMFLERTLRRSGNAHNNRSKSEQQQNSEVDEQQGSACVNVPIARKLVRMKNDTTFDFVELQSVAESKNKQLPGRRRGGEIMKFEQQNVLGYELKRVFAESKINVCETVEGKNQPTDTMDTFQRIFRNNDPLKKILARFQAGKIWSSSCPVIDQSKTSAKPVASMPAIFPPDTCLQQIMNRNGVDADLNYNQKNTRGQLNTTMRKNAASSNNRELQLDEKRCKLETKSALSKNPKKSKDPAVLVKDGTSVNSNRTQHRKAEPAKGYCRNMVNKTANATTDKHILTSDADISSTQILGMPNIETKLASSLQDDVSATCSSNQKESVLVDFNGNKGQGDIDIPSSVLSSPVKEAQETDLNESSSTVGDLNKAEVSAAELDNVMNDIMNFIATQARRVFNCDDSPIEGNALSAMMFLYANILMNCPERTQTPNHEQDCDETEIKSKPVAEKKPLGKRKPVVKKRPAKKPPMTNHPRRKQDTSGNPDLKEEIVNHKKVTTPEFVNNFRLYSKKPGDLFSGQVITKGKSSAWMKRAGLFDELFDEKLANEFFSETVGMKLVMNVQDYVKYLSKLSFGKLKVQDVIKRLGNCPPPEPKKKVHEGNAKRNPSPTLEDLFNSLPFTCSVPNFFQSAAKFPQDNTSSE